MSQSSRWLHLYNFVLTLLSVCASFVKKKVRLKLQQWIVANKTIKQTSHQNKPTYRRPSPGFPAPPQTRLFLTPSFGTGGFVWLRQVGTKAGRQFIWNLENVKTTLFSCPGRRWFQQQRPIQNERYKARLSLSIYRPEDWNGWVMDKWD